MAIPALEAHFTFHALEPSRTIPVLCPSRSLAPTKEFVCQLEQCLARLALRIRLAQTEQGQICHLFGSIIGFFIATFACQDAHQFLNFRWLDWTLLPARCKSAIDAQPGHNREGLLSFQ